MRKRTLRRVWATPPVPIAFSIGVEERKHDESNAAIALVNVFNGTGTAQHVRDLSDIAEYCGRMLLRLRQDQSCEPAALDAMDVVVTAGLWAVTAVHDRMLRLDKVGCSGPERSDLQCLLDAHKQIGAVTTRRQWRDVYGDLKAGRPVVVEGFDARNA